MYSMYACIKEKKVLNFKRPSRGLLSCGLPVSAVADHVHTSHYYPNSGASSGPVSIHGRCMLRVVKMKHPFSPGLIAQSW